MVTALLIVAAATFTVVVLRRPHPVPGQVVIPWWGMAVAYFLAGVSIAHIRIRNQAYTFTLSEVPLVLGLVAATPASLIAGGLAGTALSLILYRRQPPLKAFFNMATFLVEADLGIVVMQAILRGHAPSSSLGWLATLAGTVAASAFAQVIVIIIVLASAGVVPIRQLARTLALMLPAAVLNTVVGLSGLHVVDRDPQLAALLLIPLLVLAAAYRSYLAERQRHAQVRQLYEASGALQRSRGVEASVATLLFRAREMFNADVAEVVLMPPHGQSAAQRFVLGPGDGPLTVAAADAGQVSAELATTGPAVLLRGDSRALRTRGWRDGISVPISAAGGLRGVLLVADRRDAVSSFGRADLELLEALGGPASVSLENGRLAAELEHQAFHDPLTGLANRALLSRRVGEAYAHDPRGSFALLLLDVDDFKTVNDTLGHPAGDQLLIQIAERTTATLEAADLAARLGGDEFVVVLRGISGVEDATSRADQLLAALRRPFRLSTVDVAIQASLGVVIDDPSAADVDDLLSRADIAMYRAKAQGKDRSVLFESLMHVEVMARHQMRTDLEQAIGNGQLLLHYQPIVCLQTGTVHGAEALVRWAHPVRGMVRPDHFIPVAEESGLIVPLGRFVLAEACRQLVEWRRSLPRLRISVNVSARELQDPGFVAGVVDICEKSGADPGRLTFEVTEYVMVSDDRALASLRELRALGARIAIDDFGTGYSSLSSLRDLPVDILKVAKPFVDRLARSADDRALASSVVGLAQGLRLDTVAEGIERLDQADVLRHAGCRFGQGFLYSRALPAAEFVERVRSLESDGSILSVAG